MDAPATVDAAPSAPPPEVPQHPKRIAPVLHTIVLVALVLLFSYLTRDTKEQNAERYGRIAHYTSTMLVEWALLGYVWLGIRRRTTLRELIGGRWKRSEDVLTDLGIALLFWLGSALVLAALGFALGMVNQQAVDEVRKNIGFLAPANTLELLVFYGLAATAGFCEEIVFRGYLQRQFAALAGGIWAGITAQAVLFGAAHGYQGWKQMLRIAVLGFLFGVLAHFRNNLRSAMIAHAWQDALAGTLLRLLRAMKV